MSEPKGYLKIAVIGGVPVFVHWSFPSGGIVVALIFHVDPRHWIYYCVAYTVLVGIHEAGHALAVMAQ